MINYIYKKKKMGSSNLIKKYTYTLKFNCNTVKTKDSRGVSLPAPRELEFG